MVSGSLCMSAKHIRLSVWRFLIKWSYGEWNFIGMFPVTVFQINFSVDGMRPYLSTWAVVFALYL